MTDVFSTAKRSEVMARIRSRGNSATEVAFLRLLRSNKITGWRRHIAIKLPESIKAAGSIKRRVKPDFVFKAHRVAVFIDGCFWHGCPVHGTSPKANGEFWSVKLGANRTRDRYVNRALRKANWAVLRVWEHQLPKRGDLAMRRLSALLNRNSWT